MQKRWDAGETLLAEFAESARIGSTISDRLMDIFNGRKVLDEDEIVRGGAPPGALFLASSRLEVEKINNDAFKYLRYTGKQHMVIWAHHTAGKRGNLDSTARLNALATCPVPNSDQHYKWLGSFRNKIELAEGSRVRYLLNKCPVAGLYQGALGTVVGFGFPPGVTVEKYRMPGSRTGHDMKTAAENNWPVPLVFVQMDKHDGFKSAWKDMPGVICFKGEATPSKVNGHTRFMLPLLPAHARTYHSAQGITALCGVVLFKPARRTFALMYVGLSRIKTLSKLFLMQRVSNDDFQCGGDAFVHIKNELRRLQRLPNQIK